MLSKIIIKTSLLLQLAEQIEIVFGRDVFGAALLLARPMNSTLYSSLALGIHFVNTILLVCLCGYILMLMHAIVSVYA